MQNCVFFIGRNSNTIRVELNRRCRIDLSSSFVTRYMSHHQNNDQAAQHHSVDLSNDPVESTVEVDQNQDAASTQNDLTVSLNDSEEEADTSVIFIGEEEATPKTKKIARQSEEISKLKLRIRSLKIHNRALETKLRDAPNPKNSDDVQIDVNIGDLDMTIDEQWADNQIDEWRANGELTLVCNEFQDYLNNMQAD